MVEDHQDYKHLNRHFNSTEGDYEVSPTGYGLVSIPKGKRRFNPGKNEENNK